MTMAVQSGHTPAKYVRDKLPSMLLDYAFTYGITLATWFVAQFKNGQMWWSAINVTHSFV